MIVLITSSIVKHIEANKDGFEIVYQDSTRKTATSQEYAEVFIQVPEDIMSTSVEHDYQITVQINVKSKKEGFYAVDTLLEKFKAILEMPILILDSNNEQIDCLVRTDTIKTKNLGRTKSAQSDRAGIVLADYCLLSEI